MRYLTAGDVPQALDLSAGAGWNQAAQDWLDLIELDPESCFALECEGQLAATTTLLCYEQGLAWLGMVLTKPEFQRRGFARTLVQHALEEADSRGIKTVKLDATPQGRPLYESFGFVAEQNIERWSGSALAPRTSHSYTSSEFDPELATLDSLGYLADRTLLLERLALRNRPLRRDGGFAMYRNGLHSFYLGPCLAKSREIAGRLITATLSQENGPWLWDLLPSNTSAVALAAGFGFRMERRLVRMYRGVPLRGDESMIYAGAGFEFG